MIISLLLITVSVTAIPPAFGVFMDSLQKCARSQTIQTCFSPRNRSLTEHQTIECHWAHAGDYPGAKVMMTDGRCCFSEQPREGTFWALGESVMSRIIRIDPHIERGTAIEGYHADSQEFFFDLYEAQLTDILTVDAENSAPISGARVTMSDDSVHLTAAARETDEDGYAVFPMIPGETYSISIRADGCLPTAAVKITAPPADLSEESAQIIENVIELDRGIELRGRVLSPEGTPVEGAEIHAEISRSDGSVWISDIDRPLPVSALSPFGKRWIPTRGSYRSAENGAFLLTAVPRGRIFIYATHPNYAPSAPVRADARETSDILPIALQLAPSHFVFLRTEDAHRTAVEAQVSIADTESGWIADTISTPAKGSVRADNIPASARFTAAAEGFEITEVSQRVADGDEIVIALVKSSGTAVNIELNNEDSLPISGASLFPADDHIRKTYKQCIGKTDSSGKAAMDHCPDSFRLMISHPHYASDVQMVSSANPYQHIVLKTGKDIQIKLLENNAPVSAPCTLDTEYISDEKTGYSEKINASEGIIDLRHRPNLVHRLTCTIGDVTASASFTPDNAPEMLEFPHRTSVRILVTDEVGAPVSYARIRMNGRDYETDESGQTILKAVPGTAIKIYHYQHGQTEYTIADSQPQAEIRLPDTPPRAVIQCLEKHGLHAITDGAAIRLDIEDSARQIKRGDYAESCESNELYLIRDEMRIKSIL